MSVTNKIFSELEEALPKNSKFLVACSGGVDSIVLLNALTSHPAKLWQIEVAHFNHKLRAESDGDAEFVKRYAVSLGVKCHIGMPKTVIPQSGKEEWGRIERYGFFETLRAERGIDWILTAHSANDVVETFLFKLFSNRELRQLARVDLKRRLWRPLTRVWREEILEFATSRNLSWQEDPSNSDNTFSRNKIRNLILPKLVAEWGSELPEALLESSNAVEADLADMHMIAKERVKTLEAAPLSKEWIAHLKALLSAEAPAIGWRIIEKLFIPIIGFSLGRKHSVRMVAFILSNAAKIELPNGISIVRGEGIFKIIK